MTSSTWDDGADDSGFRPENVSKHDGGTNGFGNGSDGGADAGGGGDDDGCRICHSTEHYARECPDKPEGQGQCFNCGQEGHIKAECPDAAVVTCKICKEVGHSVEECETNRIHLMIDALGIKEMTAETSWQALEQADKDRDLDDFKEAFFAYVRSMPELTIEELEQAFREAEFNTFVIAKQQEVSDMHTIVNLQGIPGQEFVVSFQFSAKPRRVKFSEGWPTSPEENIERLSKAGFVMDGFVQKCRNCEQVGHLSSACEEEKTEGRAKVVITCGNCDEEGHLARYCTQPRKVNRNGCKNCGSFEHYNKDCTEERSAEGVECKNCNEMGHFSKDCPSRVEQVCFNCYQPGHRKPDCPNERVMKCNNCDEIGHMSKDCPKPKDWSRVECSNCKEKGHTFQRCKKPAKVEDAGEDFGDAGGGGGGGFDDPAPAAGGGGGGWEDGGDNAASAAPAAGGWGAEETPAASGW